MDRVFDDVFAGDSAIDAAALLEVGVALSTAFGAPRGIRSLLRGCVLGS